MFRAHLGRYRSWYGKVYRRSDRASGGEEVARSVRRFLKSLWYSPALIAVLVFVLGAPRKIPK